MVAARRQELGYPLRLFSIPNCFRYERPQKGRTREFWQLNADLFGVEGIEADVEIIQLADAVMKAFGAKDGSYEIRVNSRALLNQRIVEAGVKTSADAVVRIIDRYDKQPRDTILAQQAENVEQPEKLLTALENDGPSDEVKQVIARLNNLGVKSAKPVETLARGFDYYTDIVFEVFDTNPDNNRSMFGGGRYDGLVGMFGVEPVPTVGFGMGDATFMNFLESNNLVPELTPATDVAMILVGDVYAEANLLASELRSQGVNVSLDTTNRKLDKQIKAADKKQIPYVLFVGQDEIKAKEYNLKDLASGAEEKLSIEKIANTVKDKRKGKM